MTCCMQSRPISLAGLLPPYLPCRGWRAVVDIDVETAHEKRPCPFSGHEGYGMACASELHHPEKACPKCAPTPL